MIAMILSAEEEKSIKPDCSIDQMLNNIRFHFKNDNI